MVYYAHVNEDNTVERTLLEQAKVNTVIAIAGSGERVLALMDNPSVDRVITVDVNREALFLLELKIAALKALAVDDYLSFIGHTPAERKRRRDWYHDAIAALLSGDCRDYWNDKTKFIEGGVLGIGHFEKFLSVIRPMLVFFIGVDFLRILTDPVYEPNAQQRRRWKWVAWTFSKKWIYVLMGNRDDAFIGDGADVRIIPDKLTSIIARKRSHDSFLLHLILKGHLRDMSESMLPPSLQGGVLTKIKDRLLRDSISVEYHHDDLLDYVKDHPCDRRVFYSLSDIVSFEDHDYLAELLEKILKQEGTVIVVRTFVRNRISFEQLKGLVRSYKQIRFMDEHDRSGMYQVIVIER